MHDAGELLRVMTPAARAHYGCFDDEAAFLRLRHAIHAPGLHALAEALDHPAPQPRETAARLFEDSNLHKLLTTGRGIRILDCTQHSAEPRVASCMM